MGKGKSRRVGVLFSITGSGEMLPTFVCKPGVTFTEDKLRDVEDEDALERSENGWADCSVHFHAFQSLVNYKNRKEIAKMLLYLDGEGESLNVDGLSFLAHNDVTVVVFPPVTSSHLQPCDTCSFGVLEMIMACLAERECAIPSHSNAVYKYACGSYRCERGERS